MEDTPLYNSRIIKSYVEYLQKNHPEVNVSPLLQYAGIEAYQIEDEGHWFTQKQSDRFNEIIVKTTQDQDISKKVGRFSAMSRASGALGQYMLGFIKPETAYTVMGNFNDRLSRAAVMETRAVGSGKVEAKTVLRPGVVEKPYQCQYRMGTMESLAKLFTYKFAKIEHPVCIHKGGDNCRYIISWEKNRSLVWKQIRNFFSILGLAVCAAVYPFVSSFDWYALALLYILIAMSLTLFTDRLEKKELLSNIHSQGDSAERLLDQINKRYDEAMLIQEIGQISSTMPRVDDFLQSIMKSLVERLNFDRGMIMLANKTKDRLIYTVSYGYNPKDDDFLKNIQFHLDNPRSKGMAVVAFKNQKPILVNSLSDVEKDLSPKSLEFIRAMGIQSFICVPIIYRGESMGVLMVDNVQTKRELGQTEMSLLTGIAPQIGVSIMNAISHQKIRESEERFRTLSENAPDIIYTLGVNGEFTYVNPAIETILGYRPEEVIGKYFIDMTKKEDDAYRSIKAFKQVRDYKETIKGETGILHHKDGSERYFSFSCAPNLDSEGNFIGVVGTFKNLTDIRTSEIELKKSLAKLQSVMSSTIDAISIIVESRDLYTAGHQRRVAQLATAIARELGLSTEKLDLIRMGSLIHDIGKMYIPAEILTKPAKLNEIETAMMNTHPAVAWKILKQVDFIPVIVDMVYEHHERIDGSGFPRGLTGEKILLESKIIAVADVVEAMASHRPYRAARGTAAALEEIKKERGITLDTEVVDACLKLFQRGFKFKEIDSQPEPEL